MTPKIIKTDDEHAAALARIDEIFAATPGTPEGDELELLCLLVEKYEEAAFPIDLPDPVSAIRFRMEQQGLKAKDLIPFIGSASRVSEVLSGTRHLSISMIRRLVDGLGIPAEVLLKEPGAKLPDNGFLTQARQFPIREMLKRGWFSNFNGKLSEAQRQLEEIMSAFLGGMSIEMMQPSLQRQKIRDGATQDEHALLAWRIRVLNLARKETLPAYRPGTVTNDFLSQLAQLSYLESGPSLAREYLNKSGIHLVFERHLSGTHLDGAVTKLPNGAPVIGMTLRHDRIDNFWFTLLHEAAHISLHLDKNGLDAFFDDLASKSKDRCEREADTLASESLIPESSWRAAKLNARSTSATLQAFAEQNRINPAIVAGRLRFETNNYKLFPSLIGSGKLRQLLGVATA